MSMYRVVIAALCIVSASVASAQDSARRPLELGVGVGAAVGFTQGWDAQFKVEENANYHFLAVGDHPGLFAGLALTQSFVETQTHSGIFEFGARAGFSIQLLHLDMIELLLVPHVTLGAGVLLPRQGDAQPAFQLMGAVEMHASILQGMVSFWLRPIAVDGLIRDGGGGRWDIMGGAAFHM